jgi:diaminopimelate epimerase
MDWSDSTFVSLGNPHCVTFVENPAHFPDIQFKEPLKAIAYRSPEGNGQTFAEGCNLQWAYVKDRTIIDLRIFERGEGPTEASGSSASAATAAAFYRGLIERLVTVQMPGGGLKVELKGTGEGIESVIIRGSATRIMEAQIDLLDFGYTAKARYTKA